MMKPQEENRKEEKKPRQRCYEPPDSSSRKHNHLVASYGIYNVSSDPVSQQISSTTVCLKLWPWSRDKDNVDDLQQTGTAMIRLGAEESSGESYGQAIKKAFSLVFHVFKDMSSL